MYSESGSEIRSCNVLTAKPLIKYIVNQINSSKYVVSEFLNSILNV